MKKALGSIPSTAREGKKKVLEKKKAIERSERAN
jgi:hypothetical protein